MPALRCGAGRDSVAPPLARSSALRPVPLLPRECERLANLFDHDRFMVRAAEELRNLNEDQRQNLRKMIEGQRAAGKIKKEHVRWATSERLLRLMKR